MSRRFADTKEVIHFQCIDDASIVVVYDGESYRNQMSGPDAAPLDSFDASEFVEVGRLRHHDCNPGEYTWERWQGWAIEDGVSEDQAALGRTLIREADQHGWSPALQTECGWSDNGHAMLQLSLNAPQDARNRWEHLGVSAQRYVNRREI